jgi:ATP-dependent Clp endopeptidase proteolytic subunit ClpP
MLAEDKKRKKKKKEEKEPEEVVEPDEHADQEKEDSDSPMLFDISALAPQESPKIRAMGIYGTINEEKCADALFSLVVLSETGKNDVLEDPKDMNSKIISEYLPIDFYISTYGGSATDMFAVYDAIRQVRETCPIHTVGLGKVMSAGVLLLASGTKGERKVGANCRVMIHGVMSGQQGHLHDLENEMEEAKFTQRQYVKALAKETNMTEKYIKKLMDKKINVYLDAEEAVDLGIADIII